MINVGSVSGIHFPFQTSTLTRAGLIPQTSPLLVSCLENNEKQEIIASSQSSLASRASDLQLGEEPASSALASSKQEILTETQNLLQLLSAASCRLSQEGECCSGSCDFSLLGFIQQYLCDTWLVGCLVSVLVRFYSMFLLLFAISVRFLMTLTAYGTSGDTILSPFTFLEVNMLQCNLVMASNLHFLY